MPITPVTAAHRPSNSLNFQSDVAKQCDFKVSWNDGYNSPEYQRDWLSTPSQSKFTMPSGLEVAWVCQNTSPNPSYSETAYGVRFGDFLYYPDSKFYGFQGATRANNGGSVNGVLVAPVNIVDETEGLGTGIVIIATGDITGAHAGFITYAWGDLEGVHPAVVYSDAAGSVIGVNPAPLHDDEIPAFCF